MKKIKAILASVALAASALVVTASPAEAAFSQYYRTKTIGMRSTYLSGTAWFVNTGIGPTTPPPGGTNVYASVYFRSGTTLARHATIRLRFYGPNFKVLCYFSGNIAPGQTFGHNCGAPGIEQVRVFEDINYDDLNGAYADFYPRSLYY